MYSLRKALSYRLEKMFRKTSFHKVVTLGSDASAGIASSTNVDQPLEGHQHGLDLLGNILLQSTIAFQAVKIRDIRFS